MHLQPLDFCAKSLIDVILNASKVYVIGGDGTMRGAVAIFEEFKRCGLRISITGIPKNLDNDIDIIDKAFGFQAAVESAQ
ncbi:unnamed protein product [Triticum turgidum subsp. durum]|uniref:Phosphofructokinase domain-containing protein n=1 Tax=Triticum turgidum subsp. durum TaxID=4567 RepID=A0A9R1PM57_TRITD|nr:unnamed protein product [Triticum turgidum subsp. durum]